MSEKQDMTDTDDPLLAEIARAKKADPEPQLSGAAKSAIVQAVRENAARSPLTRFYEALTGGLDIILKPAAFSGLAFAGLAGLFAGGYLAGAAPAAALEPEEELIAYYEQAQPFSNFDTDEISEEGR